MKDIYFDNASTTRVNDEVLDLMIYTLSNNFGNPSSTHQLGQNAKSLIENSRSKIASYINALPSEIFFTSCGTESNNLILRSCVCHLNVRKIITTKLEHKSILETSKDLKLLFPDLKIIYLPTDKLGNFNYNDLENYIQESDEKVLVSLMYVNNEIGNLLNLYQVSKLCKKYNAFFHSDVVQSISYYPIDVKNIPIDFFSVSAHKFHAPKGVGFFYCRNDVDLKAIQTGGGQERNLRSGTENVAGIVAMDKALELSFKNMNLRFQYVLSLKLYCIDLLKLKIPNIKFSGNSSDINLSSVHILSVLLPFKDDLIGFKLNLKNIWVSQGSACNSGSVYLSSVLENILTEEEKQNKTPLRISFSHENTFEEIDYFVNVLTTFI